MNVNTFSLIPAGSEDRASSRIRVYSLQRSLVSMGKVATLGYWSEADLLLIQKNLDRHVLARAEAFRNKGGIVVYDVDDFGEALTQYAPKPYVHRMLQIAHFMTTDTAGHRDILADEFQVKHIEVIPDCIDYYPTEPIPSKAASSPPLRILWFGGADGDTFQQYGPVLADLKNTQLVLIADVHSIRDYSKRFSNIEFHAWDRSTFISILQSCHLACLAHESDFISASKSNNRMIASVNWGVPAVVSRTPEFERTAREAGVSEAVFGNTQELLVAVERLRDEKSRNEYLRKAQPQIWQSYSPEAVARRFLNTAEKYAAEFSRETASQDAGTRQLLQAVSFRTRSTAELIGEKFPLGRRIVRRGFWALRNRSVRLLFRRPAQSGLSGNQLAARKDYRALWVGPEAHTYSIGVYERQSKAGTAPLVANPTIDEVRSVLRALSPASVLEIGCGWGRLLEELTADFNIEGCDVSPEMLARCKPGLKVFQFDIAVDNEAFLRKNQQRWDVLFMRGVMLYLPEPLQVAHAMNAMLMLARKKIVVWEWPEVCDRMRQFSSSDRFEFHPIEHRNE